ncbi:MAG: transporter [Candidatus Rokubacteria bacterium RIFCSPLOWO2_12_FULL_71_22]|nr:MAG: transporter [Candidatus Rokubacteria bacterium RIFCSPLOWO2_12_FULL_71_22]
MLEGIGQGFAVALEWQNLLYCFAGVLLGTVLGVLPGIGPVAGIALLLPATYGLHPASAIIMMAGIFYGTMYGGSTTSILINVPGEASSVITCLEGYQMARRGRAGPALGIAAIGSFIAGTIGVVGLMLAAPPLARLALAFGPPEYSALIVFGLVVLAFLSSGSTLRALAMGAFGLLLGTIGLEPISGFARFTFGVPELFDGIGFIPVAMGLFGLGEILDKAARAGSAEVVRARLTHLLPSRSDWARSWRAILRGTGIGFLCGLLPGPNAVIASIVSYGTEKRLARHPEEFGRGAIEGVAGPESANNAAAAGALVPLFTLGLPSSPPTAVLLAGFLIHGLTPGPLLMQQRPDVFWGVLASMYIGNAMLLVLNLPLIGVFVRILRIPDVYLLPAVVLFCMVGAYSVGNSLADVWVMVLFGLVGFACRRGGFDTAPVVLALVLGPVLETALRQALILSDGSPAIFVTRPIAAAFLAAAAALIVWNLVAVRRGRMARTLAADPTGGARCSD